jgi:hypothetical protein
MSDHYCQMRFIGDGHTLRPATAAGGLLQPTRAQFHRHIRREAMALRRALR